MSRIGQWRRESEFVAGVLERAPSIDRQFRVGEEEFRRRWRAVAEALAGADLDCGFVYSDEHYCGDVPYLGGNTNIIVEPVAGVVGKNGFHLLAGLEGGYVAEQLAPRSGCTVHKVEMLKLADEDYPVEAERVEDVIEEATGGRPKRIGLLTPRQVLPVSIYEFLASYVGHEHVLDAQGLYQKIKYEKSEVEMRLVAEASLLSDVVLEGMLGVLKPGMYETQVASWGYLIAHELGAEELGFDVSVCSGEANRSIIGKALNRVIREGDYVLVGVAPKRDGLNACQRGSVVAGAERRGLTGDQSFWFDFIEGAFERGLGAFREVAAQGLPARLQEEALVRYFQEREQEVNRRFDLDIDLAAQKPYTGTHNSGYTECQEFYGAITERSDQPLGNQIVMMLDVAVRGIGSRWNEVKIPGLDFILVEKTLGKYGPRVEVLNRLPVNLQQFVGRSQ